MIPETSIRSVPGGRYHLGEYPVEDEAVQTARAHAQEVGRPAIEAAGGAVLRFLAALLRARAVVEIGTGTGVSGLCLLRGMAPDGVLTSIDADPEQHRLARAAFAGAGIAPGRTRLITGRALEVLPRLADSGYDLVFVDAARAEYPQYLEHGSRLLRPGGVVVFTGVLDDGGSARKAERTPEALGLRELARTVRADETLVPLLLPFGDGLLAATRT